MSEYLNSFRLRNKENLSRQDLDKRHIELSALFELSQTLNSTLELSSILSNLLFVPMGRMMIGKGCILLPDKNKKGTFKISTVKGLSTELVDSTVELEPSFKDVHLIQGKSSELPAIFFENKLKIIVPFESRGQLQGLICYGAKLTGKPYEEDELHFLKSLGNIAAPAIENARFVNELNHVNRKLDHKVQELNTLFEIGKELNRVFEQEEILKRLSYSLMGQMMIHQFAVTLCQEENDNMPQVVFKKGSALDKDKIVKLWKKTAELAEIVSPLIVDEKRSTVEKKLYDQHILVVVPMVLQARVQGYILLGPRMTNQPYTEEDIDFLSTLANISIVSLENARLFQETLEKKRLEEELSLAKSIQSRLLPSEMPTVNRFSIHGLNIPSKQVGGDYFDIIQLNESEILLTIADVSGKGMPASLLMSNLQAGIRTLQNEDISLSEMTDRLNNLIYQNTTAEKYITFFLAKLNTKSNTMRYVNAGHNPPYLFRIDNSYEVLDKGGIILGMMPNMDYETGELEIPAGSCIIMFTDGVTEAMSPNEEPFDEERVIEYFCKAKKNLSSEELNNNLIKLLFDFAGDPTKDDDITVLCIKRTE